jgi:hypothetical protein
MKSAREELSLEEDTESRYVEEKYHFVFDVVVGSSG